MVGVAIDTIIDTIENIDMVVVTVGEHCWIGEEEDEHVTRIEIKEGVVEAFENLEKHELEEVEEVRKFLTCMMEH